MSNSISYNDIRSARNAAERQIELADMAVKSGAQLISGRLRIAGVPHWVLCELKKELKDFNMHTGEWKEKP